MISRKFISRLSIAAALALTAPVGYAQDIHFTQFDMAPLVINPAFTGMFSGRVRAAAIYRRQWASVTAPYVTFGASVDMPLVVERNGDYLSGGLQLYKDQAGDGNLSNFTGMLSIAYHKSFGVLDDRNSDLAVGLQAGYAQKSIDLSKLYFGDEFSNGTFTPGISQEYHLGIGNSVNYYLVNAGISFSHRSSENFAFTLGVAGNNLNQPNDAIEKKQNSQTGLDMRLTAEAGVNWRVGPRLSLRPAVLFQSQASASELIAGNEFHYAMGSDPYSAYTTAVFLGGWYRTADAVMITAGVELKSLRIGVAYDYNISTLNAVSNGNGGIEVAIRYLLPNPPNRLWRSVPCSRF